MLFFNQILIVIFIFAPAKAGGGLIPNSYQNPYFQKPPLVAKH